MGTQAKLGHVDPKKNLAIKEMVLDFNNKNMTFGTALNWKMTQVQKISDRVNRLQRDLASKLDANRQEPQYSLEGQIDVAEAAMGPTLGFDGCSPGEKFEKIVRFFGEQKGADGVRADAIDVIIGSAVGLNDIFEQIEGDDGMVDKRPKDIRKSTAL